MSDQRRQSATGRKDISRRDFVLGRLGQLLGTEESLPRGAASAATSPRNDLVMRYPRSLEDVAANDAPPPDNVASLPATSARRRTIPVLRPPHAVEEERFLAGCTRCELCIEACPHDALLKAPDRLRQAAGTPIIDPDRQPCRMCTDFPCVAACEPNVLTMLVPTVMGTARVTEHLCLAYHGTTCTVCSEQCPVPSAIVVTDGKPTVQEAICTGCGVCRYVCLAPENAILLMPTFRRPAPPTEDCHDRNT